MANPLYTAKKPDQLLVFPQVKAFKVERETDTLNDLQALGLCPFQVDLGQPGDLTTCIITFSANGKQYSGGVGTVFVQLPSGDYEKYPNVAAFLAVYQLV